MSLPENINLTLRNAEAMIETQRADLAHSASINLKYRLLISCILPIAEKHATTEAEKKTCAYIRAAFNPPTADSVPVRRKPSLVLVEGGR